MKVFHYAAGVSASPQPWFAWCWLGALVAALLCLLWWSGRRRPDRPDAVLAAVLLLLGVSTLGPAFVRDGALVPLDMLRADPLFASLPAAEPHGNFLQHDLLVMIGPALAAAARAVGAGEWPLWHAEAGGGMPLLADPQAQVLQPLAWLALVAGPLDAFVVLAGLRLALAAIFFDLFLRRVGIGALAAGFGALLYAGGGFVQLWLGWPLANVAAWLPAVLWLLARLAAQPAQRLPRLLLALAGFGLATVGHPEAQLHAGLVVCVVFAWLLARTPRGRRPQLLGAVAWAVLVAALLAAPALLTAAGYLGESKRAALLRVRADDPDPPGLVARLGAVVAPNALGNDRFLSYWGPRNINEDGAGFAGTPALLLATLAALGVGGRWRRGERWLVLGLLATSLLVVARPAVVTDGLRALPMFAQSAADHQRVLHVTLLATAWLAARGMEGLARRRPWPLLPAVLVAGALAALLVVVYRAFPPPAESPLVAFQATWLARQLKFLAAALLLLALSSWRRLRTPARILLVALAALELHHAFASANPGVPRDPVLRETPALAALRTAMAEEPHVRVLGLGRALQPNIASWWGLADARAANPAAPWSYARLAVPLGELGLGRDLAASLTLLDRLRVRWLVGPSRGPTPPGFELAYGDADARLWRRRAAGIPAFEGWATLLSATRAEVRARSVRRGRQEIAVAATSGWRALAAGVPARVDRSRDDALLTVSARAPGAALTLLYRPRGLFLGALAAACGLGLWLTAALPPPLRRLRQSKSNGRRGPGGVESAWARSRASRNLASSRRSRSRIAAFSRSKTSSARFCPSSSAANRPSRVFPPAIGAVFSRDESTTPVSRSTTSSASQQGQRRRNGSVTA
jgi:hypothetical protein